MRPVGAPVVRRPGYPGPQQRYEEVEIVPADLMWRVLVWHFMPEGNVDNRVKEDRVEYNVWIKEGFIFTTPGSSIDYDFIKATIADMASKFHIMELGYDSWNAQQMANELAAAGMKMVEVRQGFKTMSDPMKRLLALVLDKKFEHYGDPVLTWEAGNVQAISDPRDNIAPDKKRSREKIDGIVAVIMAMQRIAEIPATGDSPYNKRGIIFL